MKVLDITPAAEKALASLLLQSLGEINGRSLTQISGLEALGVLAMRMLVASEQIALQPLVTIAVNQVSEQAFPVSLPAVREGMTTLFDDPDHLKAVGITPHTMQ